MISEAVILQLSLRFSAVIEMLQEAHQGYNLRAMCVIRDSLNDS